MKHLELSASIGSLSSIMQMHKGAHASLHKSSAGDQTHNTSMRAVRVGSTCNAALQKPIKVSAAKLSTTSFVLAEKMTVSSISLIGATSNASKTLKSTVTRAAHSFKIHAARQPFVIISHVPVLVRLLTMGKRGDVRANLVDPGLEDATLPCHVVPQHLVDQSSSSFADGA